MAQQVVSKVPFVLDTVGKCLCPGCPVQASSQCVSGLKKQLNDALKNDPLKHEQVPGAYCAAGKATCTDLDPSKSCMCGGCAIFSRYNLGSGKPAAYFCREGSPR